MESQQESQSSRYTGIAEFYDLLMSSGYYDHDGLADAFCDIVEADANVLEVGVGTGLFAEALKRTAPGMNITGVDITPSMLSIARRRLDDDVRLVEGDIASMQLDDTFDVAVSSGGVWVIIDEEKGHSLGSHNTDVEDDVRALKNLARHLRPGGRLLLNVQRPHQKSQRTLPAGILYSQTIRDLDETDDYSRLEKTYYFIKGGEILGEETLHLTFYKQRFAEELMKRAGFEAEDTTGSQFHVYRKRE